MLHVPRPVPAVRRTPDVIEEFSLGLLRRLVSAAAHHIHPAAKDGSAADHAALRPIGFLGIDFSPVHSIVAVPYVAIENLIGFRESRHRLAAHDPEFALKGKRVMQGPWSPGDFLGHTSPNLAVARIPDVVMI